MKEEYSKLKYSFVVCVNDQNLFMAFVDSLAATNISNYEIIKIDNFNKNCSLPEALNKGRALARGDILFFCHQDILFPSHWLEKVVKQIRIVSDTDSKWGVLGVIGVKKNGFFAGNIIDPHTHFKMGRLPCQVTSLDEVCLIIKKDVNLYFDEGLGGFHLYGADICLQALNNGLNCYAIDACLTHLSAGKRDKTFFDIADKLKKKWSQKDGSPITIETTCGVCRLDYSYFSKIEYFYKLIRRKTIRKIQRWMSRTNL